MKLLKNKHLPCFFSHYFAVFFIFMMSFISTAFADSPQGLGDLAERTVEGPLTFLLNFINETCYVLGIGLVIAGVSKYFTHRQSPQMVPLSVVIVYIILGIVTFLLPFVLYLMDTPTNLTLFT